MNISDLIFYGNYEHAGIRDSFMADIEIWQLQT
jgi:hypothetical protein